MENNNKKKPEDTIHWIVYVFALIMIAFFAMGIFSPVG